MQLSAYIGVTLYPQDGVDADQLMRHADQAMYVAKQAGKIVITCLTPRKIMRLRFSAKI
jgi:GGDEF domain-containing protein